MALNNGHLFRIQLRGKMQEIFRDCIISITRPLHKDLK
ncbi:hypothetical protein [uncultured Gammaproteobacteria bacterium]|nr:hypothetical protein BROOK1789C_2201 [Bathymodiolus brooksi thiotrophic gill symbiont]CAC9606362.1 hypothetical protein [uncultured Gammaproteobacteria bacterium]CAC9608133.1 hypothetical protein [uncultured Gammaproteobacteria bacterium]CAC9609707.1 hypothetical protein [uncultured Gammaproteobacteria bacterium]CAC9620993.1 hypothetical protein [uncultured Gammaproteobacteria bacterium]